MKKFLSLLLALTMVLSLGVVAFADEGDTTNPFTINISDDGEKGNEVPVNAVGPDYYLFSGDDNIMKMVANDYVAYGDTVYYPITDSEGALIAKSDAIKGIKPKTDWEMNGDMVESVEIVKKKAPTELTEQADGSKKLTDSGYGYFLAVKTKASTKTAATDIIGTVTLKKSTGDYKIANPDKEVDAKVDLTVQYKEIIKVDETKVMDVIYKDKRLYKFDDHDAEDEEWEFSFDQLADATFVVNTIGQGDLILAADVKYNADVAAKYPSANLDFFNGNGASFNKTGEMFIPCDEGSYLYELKADGSLSLKADPEDWDDYDEGFYFKTRTLGTYVISDEELDIEASAPSVEPGEGDVQPSNPSTGAAA